MRASLVTICTLLTSPWLLAGCLSSGCYAKPTLTWHDQGLASQAAGSPAFVQYGNQLRIPEENASAPWILARVIEASSDGSVKLEAASTGVWLTVDVSQDARNNAREMARNFLGFVSVWDVARVDAWLNTHPVIAGTPARFDGILHALANRNREVFSPNEFWMEESSGSLWYDRTRPHLEFESDTEHLGFDLDGDFAWWSDTPSQSWSIAKAIDHVDATLNQAGISTALAGATYIESDRLCP